MIKLKLEYYSYILMFALIVVAFPIVYYYNKNAFELCDSEEDCDNISTEKILACFAGIFLAVITYEELYSFDALCKSLQKYELYENNHCLKSHRLCP